MHKRAEGMETKIKLTGVRCCVSDESIHPEQHSASVFLVDELRRGSQVQVIQVGSTTNIVRV